MPHDGDMTLDASGSDFDIFAIRATDSAGNEIRDEDRNADKCTVAAGHSDDISFVISGGEVTGTVDILIICESAAPTMSPSVDPTASPSENPSAEPTRSPSAEPSESPSADPSKAPTPSPSGVPTSEPSAQPTSSPVNTVDCPMSTTAIDSDMNDISGCGLGCSTQDSIEDCRNACDAQSGCVAFSWSVADSGCALYDSDTPTQESEGEQVMCAVVAKPTCTIGCNGWDAFLTGDPHSRYLGVFSF